MNILARWQILHAVACNKAASIQTPIRAVLFGLGLSSTFTFTVGRFTAEVNAKRPVSEEYRKARTQALQSLGLFLIAMSLISLAYLGGRLEGGTPLHGIMTGLVMTFLCILGLAWVSRDR